MADYLDTIRDQILPEILPQVQQMIKDEVAAGIYGTGGPLDVPPPVPTTTTYNVNINFPKPLVVFLTESLTTVTGSGPAVATRLKFSSQEEANMPSTITVDTTNETVTLDFVDDKGNTTPAPTGAVVAFTPSDPAVATVAVDPANPLQGDISPLTPGSVTISASVTGATEADGVTPFPDATSGTLTVDPGAAAGARLTLS